MGAETISRVLDGSPGGAAIIKHIKEHCKDGHIRQVDVEPELPARERVLNLQRLQLDEVERRIELAKTRADLMNSAHKDDEAWTPVDWSDFTDILGKDMQSAIGSILKTQGLSDKREKAVADTKIGLFEAMVGAGLAPKALVGSMDVKALQSGEENESIILHSEGEDG
jgi:hypothetical protein